MSSSKGFREEKIFRSGRNVLLLVISALFETKANRKLVISLHIAHKRTTSCGAFEIHVLNNDCNVLFIHLAVSSKGNSNENCIISFVKT